LILVNVAVSGQTLREVTPDGKLPTAGQMIKNAKGTFFLQAATQWFHVIDRDTPGGVRLQLDPQHEGEVRVRLDRLMAELRQAHRNKLPALTTKFGPTIVRNPSIKLKFSNDGLAKANTQTDGTISVDANVLGAMLLTVLGADLEGDPKGSATQALTDFTKIGAQWKDLTERKDFDLLSAVLGYEVLKDGVEALQRIDRTLWGMMAFVLAHEMGHVALGHGTDLSDCDKFRKRELDADYYAVLLLSESFMQASIDVLDIVDPDLKELGNYFPAFFTEPSKRGDSLYVTFINPEKIKQFAGYSAFLSIGFELAGFDPDHEPVCEYPLREVRIRQAHKVELSVVDQLAASALRERARQRRTRENIRRVVGGLRSATSIGVVGPLRIGLP
jgi:hypothetical protein